MQISQQSNPLSDTPLNLNPVSGQSLKKSDEATPLPVFDSPCGTRAKGKTVHLEEILQTVSWLATYSQKNKGFVVTKRVTRTSKTYNPGDMLGTINYFGTTPYYRLWINKRHCMIHELVWLWHYGTWPRKEIDHINGDSLDNSINNLRDVPRRLNHKNQKKHSTNTSGYTGVYKAPQGYLAQVMIDYKKHHIPGSFRTPKEAAQARELYLKRFQNNAGFTNRHGESK